MMKTMPLAALLILVAAAPSIAGENPNAKLAMHVVASHEYLYCPELIPAACESINVDVSVQEILAASGYGYVAFAAYDVESITGAEFAVEGWPTGRGAPVLSGPYWCPEDALTLGDPLNGGGITAFPCAEASGNGIVLVGYCSFGPLDEGDLPITLEYTASSFSYPSEPHNFVLDCTVDYEEDTVVAVSGCTIGGTHEGQPDCAGEVADGGPGGEGDGLYMEATIDDSYLYILGNYIPRPYHLVLDGDTISLNGIPLDPLRQRAEPPPLRPSSPSAEADSLNELVVEQATRLEWHYRGLGLPLASVLDSVAAFYRMNERVRSVTRSGTHIGIRWQEGSIKYFSAYTDTVTYPANVKDPESRKIRAFDQWRQNLETRKVIVVGRGISVLRGGRYPSRLHEMIQRFQAGEIPRDEIADAISSEWAVNALANPAEPGQ